MDSNLLVSQSFGFNVPTGASIQSLTIGYQADATGSGSPSLVIAQGTSQWNVQAVSSTPTLYTSTFSNGLTSAIINSLVVNFSANLQGSPLQSSTFNVNKVSATVVYTVAGFTDPLRVTVYGFTVPSTSSVLGFKVLFNAFSTNATTAVIQLLKNGQPVGTPESVVLTATPTEYTLGAGADLWGAPWSFADVNNNHFGLQVTATGSGTTSIQNVRIETALASSLSNFNYVKTYKELTSPAGVIPQINNLALDAEGNMWLENLTATPGELDLALTGIFPGSFAKSVTLEDREYIVFSDLTQGTDRPRIVNGFDLTPLSKNFFPLSQVGPGAPPAFQAAIGTTDGTTLALTSYALTSNVVTFQYTGVEPGVGTLYRISGITGGGAYLNGATLEVLSTGLTSSQFEAAFVHGNDGGGSITGLATLTFSYPISSITQTAQKSTELWLWSDGPGSTKPGNVLTIYYATGPTAQDKTIAQMTKAGLPIYVYLSNSTLAKGTFLITSTGQANPPGLDHQRWYFTVNTGSTQYTRDFGGSGTGKYQITLGTLTLQNTSPIPNLNPGDSLVVGNSSPTNWNGTWAVVSAPNSGLLNISNTAMSATGVATYQYTVQNGVDPVMGNIIKVTNTTNGNGIFNATGVVSSVGGGQFTITGFASGAITGAAEFGGVGQTFGTIFTIDPGVNTLGTQNSPIFGSAATGQVTIVGGSIQPVGPGTRQAVVFFITETGYETAPSPPITFTTTSESNFIAASNVPIGPPNTIARGIAFTEAGQNGVPGANFYVIDDPVTINVEGTINTYSSTIIRDNTSTTAQFTFTDAVLLNSRPIDVQAADLFNLIEVGACGWAVPYAGRMFYGLQQNKVQNLINTTFDGGYLPNQGGNITPLGWAIDDDVAATTGIPVTITAYSVTSNIVTVFTEGSVGNRYTAGQTIFFAGLGSATFLNGEFLEVLASGLSSTQFQVAFTTGNVSKTSDSGTATSVNAGITLLVSPTGSGNSLFIENAIEGFTAQLGLISQTAYVDAFQVPIIRPNTTYSVRVTCRCPSGAVSGSMGLLAIDLTDQFLTNSTGQAWGTTYGDFVLSLLSMTSEMAVYTGTILTTAFTTGVSPNLRLRVVLENSMFGESVEIDRIELFPTAVPLLSAQVYGSYISEPEALDASSNGGIIDTTSENSQTVFGGIVMKNSLYLLKESSIYSTEDTPQSEPGGWSLDEVSQRVGTCGINAYDAGEEWFVTACRAGVFGSDGREPQKLMHEIRQVWDAINWNAAKCIVLRNNVQERKLYVAVPMPTGPGTTSFQWLPNAPVNTTPTTPNVILMLNWQGCDSFSELVAAAPEHVTMFGSLMATDMKRKWTIWQIPTPYMDFISNQSNGVNAPLYICNGNQSSNIYQLLDSQKSDNGVAINSDYCTYGFVNTLKAKEFPLLGMMRKQFNSTQLTLSGKGNVDVTFRKNVLNDPFPYSIPTGIGLSDPAYDDAWRPLNQTAQRVFVELSTDTVGEYFNLSKVTLIGRKAPHSPINPTGGMNVGISTDQKTQQNQ